MPRPGLGRNSLLLLASTWGYSGLGVIASVLIGRGLGPDALGAIAVNLGYAGLALAALLPGFGQAHLKRLAEGQDAGRCVGTMLAIQSALAVPLLAVVAVAWIAGAVAAPTTNALVLAFMLAAQLTSRFGEAFLRVFLAREWVETHGAIILGGRVLRLVATLAVLLWLPDVVWVAATFWLESVLVGATAALVLRVRYGIDIGRPTRQSFAMYWTYSRPFLVTTPIAMVQDSIDRVLIGRLAGLTAAGYYQVARGLWEILGSAQAPVGLLLFTRLSSLYASRTAKGDTEARTLFLRTLDKLLFLITGLALPVWILSPWAVRAFYGPEFDPAVPVLRILVLASVAAAIVNPYTHVLQAQDQVGRLIPVNVVRLAFYVATLAVIIPETGLPGWLAWLPSGAGGAAVARVLLLVFPAWVWIGWARELGGIPFYWRAWTHVVGLSVALAAYHAVAALAIELATPRVIADLGAGLIAAGVYLGCLVSTNPDARGHLRSLSDLLRLRHVGGPVRWIRGGRVTSAKDPLR